VKPKHLVAVRGFLSFVALCQLVISLNVKLAHAHVFFNVSALILFPQKSGDADNRPPSMAIMFDGVQFFSFSLDIVRPECSVSIDAVLKATVIGALPVVVSIVMMLVSSLMAFRKARVLRQAILASVPNLMQEMSIRWILYHALLDAFVIQKPVFHRELKYASTNLTSLNIRTFETACVFFGVY
jgi:hypothetical protein